MPDIQLANVLAYIEHSQRPLPKGTSSEQMFEHAGAWGEEIGAQIAEIIARDCEAVHED